MNKNFIIGAVVAAIIAIAAVGYFMMNAGQSPSSESSDATTETGDSSMSRASMRSLLGLGKNVTCTVKYDENSSAGTIYVAGDRMRGDFTTPEVGEMSHMITDGEYSWVWTGSQGFKMKIDDQMDAASPAGQSQETKQADLDEEVDMDCSNWSVDESMFTPPSDVQFTEFGDSMMKMQESMQGADKMMDSSACDQIADPQAKAACMSALGQ